MVECLGKATYVYCHICEKPAYINVNSEKCPTYGCPGIYCYDCFEQLRNQCLFCHKIFTPGTPEPRIKRAKSSDLV